MTQGDANDHLKLILSKLQEHDNHFSNIFTKINSMAVDIGKLQVTESDIKDHDKRIRTVESDMSAVKVKTGLISGLSGGVMGFLSTLLK